MERLTEVENGTAMIKDCGSNCKYGFEYCRKEDWENCKTIDDVINKLAEFEDFEEIFREKMTDVACDILGDKEEFGKWLERNQWIAKKCDEYARAEEQGLLLRLPCKIGDTAWYIDTEDYNTPIEVRITRIAVKETYILYYAEVKEICDTLGFTSDDFGKTVFLAKEEAEQRIKEIENSLICVKALKEAIKKEDLEFKSQRNIIQIIFDVIDSITTIDNNTDKIEANIGDRHIKTTGIIRRFDDLGRIVIPREIRKQLFGTINNAEGMPMEVFTNDNNEVILRKYEGTDNISE